MKKLTQIVFVLLLLGMFVLPVQAFTSLHIFGDGISTTTNNASAGQYYYGLRESNGRVWVEVLAQRLGLGANSTNNVNWSNSSNNWSYFGQYSQNLATNINYFVPPQDAKTALFVVWVNDADFDYDMVNIYLAGNYINSTLWGNAITQSLNNQWSIINSLYAKGVRTLVMPNAVDITEIPAFDNLAISAPSNRTWIRNQVISFNSQFTAMLNQAQAALPGLKIYEPDFFSLLDNTLTNASAYGLTNALLNGVSIDAYSDPNIPTLTLNGQGTNYIFWCKTAPTAKLNEIMADTAMQMIAPAQISSISIQGNVAGSTVNQLAMANIPVGLNGYVEGCTNLGQVPMASTWNWTTVATINSTSTTQSVSFPAPPLLPYVEAGGPNPILGGLGGLLGQGGVPASPGVMETYRVRFPMAWNWP
jgi:phospholipase/lecithinase/hemolysin